MTDGLAALTIAYGVTESDLLADPREAVLLALEDRHDQFLSAKAMELLACPICVGFWSAASVQFLPGRVRRWLAAAGLIVALIRYMGGD